MLIMDSRFHIPITENSYPQKGGNIVMINPAIIGETYPRFNRRVKSQNCLFQIKCLNLCKNPKKEIKNVCII